MFLHHFLRKSLATNLHANNATRTTIKRAGNRKSNQVAESYIVDSIAEKRRTASLLRASNSQSGTEISLRCSDSPVAKKSRVESVLGKLQFNNCQEITINMNSND